MVQNRYQRNVQNGRYYPYPASHSYYPTRNYPYKSPKKPLYPLALIFVGILLIAFSFMKVEKLDPQISKMMVVSPDAEIAAVVFCSPCNAIDGEVVGTDKRMVTDTAVNIGAMINLPGVSQIQMVGSLSSN